MSPMRLTALPVMSSFPRVSGDEPVVEDSDMYVRTFSPCERG